MLMRVSLNSNLLNLDRAVDYFIAKKQQTFKAYVEMKMEHYKKKQGTSRFIIYCILNFLVYRESIDYSDDEVILEELFDK